MEKNSREKLGQIIARSHSCRCVVETKTVDALRKSVEWLQYYKYMKGYSE